MNQNDLKKLPLRLERPSSYKKLRDKCIVEMKI